VHAIEVAEHGGPEVLDSVDGPRPSPGPGEVLIKAEAIGVNFVDTYFRSGLYPHELPFVLGAEVAGTVAAVGDGVASFRIGDRVAGADAAGAYAEYCVAPADLVAGVPAVHADLSGSHCESHDDQERRTKDGESEHCHGGLRARTRLMLPRARFH
jgi:NADPH:quinone reductase-like Zn-dependent oxidoreductase